MPFLSFFFVSPFLISLFVGFLRWEVGANCKHQVDIFSLCFATFLVLVGKQKSKLNFKTNTINQTLNPSWVNQEDSVMYPIPQ
jgi:hypothetical protein